MLPQGEANCGTCGRCVPRADSLKEEPNQGRQEFQTLKSFLPVKAGKSSSLLINCERSDHIERALKNGVARCGLISRARTALRRLRRFDLGIFPGEQGRLIQ